MLRHCPPCVVLCLFAALTTQVIAQHLVFPAANEGASHGTIPGLRRDRRQQILLPAAALAPLRNTTIHALAFRRDGRLRQALAGGTVHLTLALSTSPREPQAASAVFGANHTTSPTTVFQGLIAVPAAPPVQGTPSFDDPLQSIQIPFATPFRYASGTLVIDIRGTNTGTDGSLWPVDFATDLRPAITSARGTACGQWAAPTSRTMAVGNEGLMPGSVARFTTWTNPHSAALLMFGVRAIDFDLTPFGASGCHLLVEPLLTLSAVARDAGAGPGIANLRLQLPVLPSLLGAPLVAQWAHVEAGQASNPLRLTTSQATDMVLSTALPASGFATITSLPATSGSQRAEGDVTLQRVPVLRLSYR